MSPSLLLASLWVVAATVTALLPMRRQYVPRVTLLVLAPFLLGYIGWQHGFWIAALGLAAFVSMFRNPLRYLWRRARGEKPEIPR
jgi:hypothetical protein